MSNGDPSTQSMVRRFYQDQDSRVSDLLRELNEFRISEKEQMEFECEQAEERIKWNKSFRIIFIVTFTALNFGIFAIQA